MASDLPSRSGSVIEPGGHGLIRSGHVPNHMLDTQSRVYRRQPIDDSLSSLMFLCLSPFPFVSLKSMCVCVRVHVYIYTYFLIFYFILMASNFIISAARVGNFYSMGKYFSRYNSYPSKPAIKCESRIAFRHPRTQNSVPK